MNLGERGGGDGGGTQKEWRDGKLWSGYNDERRKKVLYVLKY